jgi:cobalt-precorrin 5A hydrolase/precorrin-3B C17-methyltransferase
MNVAILRLAGRGEHTAAVIAAALGNTDIYINERKGGLAGIVADVFPNYDGIVFLMATGIVVRLLAPHLTDKYHDPAVVVVDDAERFAVSLLSGHEGGANRLAARVGAALNAEPVITTATDTNRRLVLGIGCRRGVSEDEVTRGILAALERLGGTPGDVRTAATIEAKRGEAGLTAALAALDIPVRYIPHRGINHYAGPYQPSEAAMRHLGVRAVAEPCALLAGRNAALVLRRQIVGPVTIAVAREDAAEDATHAEDAAAPSASVGSAGDSGGAPQPPGDGAGVIFTGTTRERSAPSSGAADLTVVGIGPGDAALITPMARGALARADLVVGYTTYLDLLGDLISGKERFTSGMRKETERAAHAIAEARAGRRVCVVSSGDAGVYGMAGLVLELLAASSEPWPSLQVVPGVTAAHAAASLLGAPLMHDHAVISLSDLLTPWHTIETRLRHAAEADLAVALYNPKSMRRSDHLERARLVMLEFRTSETPVGVVSAAYRDDCSARLTTLGDLPSLYDEVGMNSVVVVGNATSYVARGAFITPRGYRLAHEHRSRR